MASTNNTKMTREEQLYLAAIINANRYQKLHELAHLIKWTPAGTAPPATKTKAASNLVNTRKKHYYLERRFKLRELGKMISG
ncbi:MAG: hypothetical protein WBL49_11375 [Nitrososphaeraceae archaeon]